MAYAGGEPMLQNVFNVLLLRRLEPRWVEGEIHVDVRGRAFAVAHHPAGVAVRKRAADSAAEVYEEPGDAFTALGL
jgi:hypothetical protein